MHLLLVLKPDQKKFNLIKENMKNLTNEELMNIQGGIEPSFLEKAAFLNGYLLGSALDFAHGLFHGLTDTEH